MLTLTKQTLIKQLSSSKLYAECPKCREEFQLKDIILFDGLEPFPQEALEAQTKLQSKIYKRLKQLKKKSTLADTGAEPRAYSVGLGKILEAIAPMRAPNQL